ncbi:uncharacterized protein LOC122079678 [Macadamia integrifolia]|uniref:uncharacterized protein LOC122079678 n=1 Tax=Macadamia integrifolia TaxID=60698 RepID=UPI001C4EA977|nr:uncharacterized protein LOC122079678 [Macadamia integrifolia]
MEGKIIGLPIHFRAKREVLAVAVQEVVVATRLAVEAAEAAATRAAEASASINSAKVHQRNLSSTRLSYCAAVHGAKTAAFAAKAPAKAIEATVNVDIIRLRFYNMAISRRIAAEAATMVVVEARAVAAKATRGAAEAAIAEAQAAQVQHQASKSLTQRINYCSQLPTTLVKMSAEAAARAAQAAGYAAKASAEATEAAANVEMKLAQLPNHVRTKMEALAEATKESCPSSKDHGGSVNSG